MSNHDLSLEFLAQPPSTVHAGSQPTGHEKVVVRFKYTNKEFNYPDKDGASYVPEYEMLFFIAKFVSASEPQPGEPADHDSYWSQVAVDASDRSGNLVITPPRAPMPGTYNLKVSVFLIDRRLELASSLASSSLLGSIVSDDVHVSIRNADGSPNVVDDSRNADGSPNVVDDSRNADDSRNVHGSPNVVDDSRNVDGSPNVADDSSDDCSSLDSRNADDSRTRNADGSPNFDDSRNVDDSSDDSSSTLDDDDRHTFFFGYTRPRANNTYVGAVTRGRGRLQLRGGAYPSSSRSPAYMRGRRRANNTYVGAHRALG
ncbi:hypothetical protein V8E54_000759 [Elaphomyces granulatus]